MQEKKKHTENSLLNNKLIEKICIESLNIETYHYSRECKFSGLEYYKILSASQLRSMHTPFHLLRYIEVSNKPSQAELLNQALKLLITESTNNELICFDDSEIVKEIGGKNPRGTKKYRNWKKEYCQEDGKTLRKNIIPKKEYEMLINFKNLVEDSALLRELCKDAAVENSIFQKFENGLYTKIRPDYLKVANKQIVEKLHSYNVQIGDLLHIKLKPTRNASWDKFEYELKLQNYELKAAFYHDLLQRYYGNDINIHDLIIALEQETNLFTIRIAGNDFLERGRKSYSERLETYMECSKNEDFRRGYEVWNSNSLIKII